MKRIAYCLMACALAASSALAGAPSGKEMKESKGMPAPVPCFKDQELQLDLFGSFTDPHRALPYDEGAGGGIGVNYFFLRYVGIGLSGNVYDGHADGVWDFAGSLILRYPLELGRFCIAPYIFGGGGLRTSGDDDHHFDTGSGRHHNTRGTEHGGIGFEVRITPRIGVFTDCRYTWAEDRQDALTSRLGVRFVF